MEIAGIIIATLSLFLSGYAIYNTSIKRGKVKITHPTIISFLYDGVKDNAKPKIFVRGLLYSTAQKGNIIENLYVKLNNGQSSMTFSTWGYGTKNLVRGSGLFIPKHGVVENHHFTTRSTTFNFSSPEYTLEICATVFGVDHKIKLFNHTFKLNRKVTKTLSHRTTGILFNWNPERNEYEPEGEEMTFEKLGKLLIA